MRARWLLAAILVAAGCLAGCGHTAESPAAFRTALDTACRRMDTAEESLINEARRRHLDVTEFSAQLQASATHMERTIAAARPPAQLAAADRRFLADLRAAAKPYNVFVSSVGTVASARARARRAVKRLELARTRRIRADERALGATVCLRITSETPPVVDG